MFNSSSSSGPFAFRWPSATESRHRSHKERPMSTRAPPSSRHLWLSRLTTAGRSSSTEALRNAMRSDRRPGDAAALVVVWLFRKHECEPRAALCHSAVLVVRLLLVVVAAPPSLRREGPRHRRSSRRSSRRSPSGRRSPTSSSPVVIVVLVVVVVLTVVLVVVLVVVLIVLVSETCIHNNNNNNNNESSRAITSSLGEDGRGHDARRGGHRRSESWCDVGQGGILM